MSRRETEATAKFSNITAIFNCQTARQIRRQKQILESKQSSAQGEQLSLLCLSSSSWPLMSSGFNSYKICQVTRAKWQGRDENVRS